MIMHKLAAFLLRTKAIDDLPLIEILLLFLISYFIFAR